MEDIKVSKLATGKFTEQNTRDAETAQETLSHILVDHLNVLALQNFTNHVWLEKRGEAYSVFLPPQLGDELQTIKDKRLRQELLEEFAHPFSIGAASIDFGTDELQNGKRISKRAARQLAKIDKLIAIRQVGISRDISCHHIEISLVFQIHPLTIDYGKQRAFHRITVGLFIRPEWIGSDFVTKNPSDWSESDIKTLWKELLKEVDNIADQLIPKAESQNSIIYSVNVNARLDIPLTSLSPEESNAAIKKVFDDLAQGRQIREISVKPAESACAVNQPKPNGTQVNDEKVPSTLEEGLLWTIWNSRFRWLIIGVVVLAIAAFAVYTAQPDEVKIRILKHFGFYNSR